MTLFNDESTILEEVSIGYDNKVPTFLFFIVPITKINIYYHYYTCIIIS